MYLWWDKDQTVRALSSHAWQMTLRGISNTIRPPIDNRAAMTLEHLYRVVGYCSANPSYLYLAVAVTLGFFGYLRVSNLAPQSQEMFDATRHTTLGDITQSSDGLLFRGRGHVSPTLTHSPFPYQDSVTLLCVLYSAGSGTLPLLSKCRRISTHRYSSPQET